MNVRVTKGIVKAEGQFYPVGKIIVGLTAQDISYIKRMGFGKATEEQPDDPEEHDEDDEDPEHQSSVAIGTVLTKDVILKMSKNDLLAVAEEHGIDVSTCTTNAQRQEVIIEALGL